MLKPEEKNLSERYPSSPAILKKSGPAEELEEIRKGSPKITSLNKHGGSIDPDCSADPSKNNIKEKQ